MDPRTQRLLEGPIGSTLLRLALPNIVLTLVQASIGLIETYFVAKLGTDALAGMALVFPVVMLIQMMSAGAMGGGISSAIARALGSGRGADADALVWHAAAIAFALGLITTLAALLCGPALYAAMGGTGGSLAAALAYSNTLFVGATFIWLFNSLANVIRGTGNMLLPAAVTCVGAAVLIPLSPVLIFGIGPLPRLGIVGGAAAVLAYYAAGTFVFAVFLWSGRSVLRPSPRPPRLHWRPSYEILRVGAVASLVTVTTNLTIAIATGFAGSYGPAAVAGYGTGVRLEYLLVPLVFGLGAPLVAMVGTSIGAGRRERHCAWRGPARPLRAPSPRRSASPPRSIRRHGSACSAAIPRCWRSGRNICASSGRSTASSAPGSRSILPPRAQAGWAGRCLPGFCGWRSRRSAAGLRSTSPAA